MTIDEYFEFEDLRFAPLMNDLEGLKRLEAELQRRPDRDDQDGFVRSLIRTIRQQVTNLEDLRAVGLGPPPIDAEGAGR